MNNLRKAMQQYLEERRLLGFKLYQPGLLLSQFIRFLEGQGAAFTTKELALRWATLPRNCHPAHWAKRLTVIRQFAQYLSATDPRTEVPPQSLLPYKYQRKQPYIYTEKQILELINAAKKLNSGSGLRALTYSTFFGLLAVTGMRISESIGLNCEDVDLKEGVLIVRQTKLGKHRLIPIHTSTAKALRNYVYRRDRIHPKAKAPSFFVSERGTRLTKWTVRRIFVLLSRQIGLRGPHDSHGPRLHDLRHGFAIRTLLNWYRASVDIERHMPELSTYLGHSHVSDTYWYISAVPELLQLATLRLEYEQGGKLS